MTSPRFPLIALVLSAWLALTGCQPGDVRDAAAKAVAVGVNKSCNASDAIRARFGDRIREDLDKGNDIDITCASD